MRTANLAGRLMLIRDGLGVDVATASGGRFGPDPQAVLECWLEFRDWAESGNVGMVDAVVFDESQAGPVVPRPRQVFAVGLNYDAHARESGFVRPQAPVVFTKYPSSLSGPCSVVQLPTDTVDWEVELVVVLGRPAREVSASDAWSYVAGVTVGQDLSERTSQHAGPAPQFGLAKSFPGFSPIGPVLVTPDELDDRDDLGLGCAIDGEQVQAGRTGQMIFNVAELVSHLSSIVTLYPGDLIFTGTPAGVGAGRTPPRYLQHGETLVSWIDGIGSLTQTFRRDSTALADEFPTQQLALR